MNTIKQSSDSKLLAADDRSKEAILLYFNEYTVHYYSQSSNPWEAAYINCFQGNNDTASQQIGYIIFTYPEGTTPPGQENSLPGALPTNIPATQFNHFETRNGRPFFVIYYALERFNDVVNLLRYCVDAKQSMFVSADATANVWALCNNIHVPLGAQYKV
jgi:hypothetical protein